MNGPLSVELVSPKINDWNTLLITAKLGHPATRKHAVLDVHGFSVNDSIQVAFATKSASS